jgi:hypothetical protein
MTTNLPTRHLSHLRKKPRDDDEPLSLSSFSTFEEKTQETTMSREDHHHLLHMKKKPRDDNKPPSSSSPLEKKIKR